ncbi:MAG: ArsR family transcriptional regulator [Alphaproteobacteria bacterium]|nr:MAG: ArsR family transcriptional regulator [Alphaproteobacteria bacterium]
MIDCMRPLKHPAVHELILERVLYALSDPVRMEIVHRLAGLPEASCGDLDGGRPKSTVSHHFRVLRESGLIQTECAGTTHMNKLRLAELEARFPGLLTAILRQRGEGLS